MFTVKQIYDLLDQAEKLRPQVEHFFIGPQRANCVSDAPYYIASLVECEKVPLYAYEIPSSLYVSLRYTVEDWIKPAFARQVIETLPEQRALFESSLSAFENIANIHFGDFAYSGLNIHFVQMQPFYGAVFGMASTADPLAIRIDHNVYLAPHINNQGYLQWGSIRDRAYLAVNKNMFNALYPMDDKIRTSLHEGGHDLGLKHGFEVKKLLPRHQQNIRFSIMNYEKGHVLALNPISFDKSSIQVVSINPTAFDTAALQFLYGKNVKYNAGNTHYLLGATSNNLRLSPLETIYDPSGLDVFDASEAPGDAIIDINEGPYHTSQFCNADLQECHFYSVAFNTQVENIIASQGNNIIIPNPLDNYIDISPSLKATIIISPHQAGNDTVQGFNSTRGDNIVLLAHPWDFYSSNLPIVTEPAIYSVTATERGCLFTFNNGTLLTQNTPCDTLKNAVRIDEYPSELESVLSEMQKAKQDNFGLYEYFSIDKDPIFDYINITLRSSQRAIYMGCSSALTENIIKEIATKKNWTKQQYIYTLEGMHFLLSLYFGSWQTALSATFVSSCLNYFNIKTPHIQYAFLATNLLSQYMMDYGSGYATQTISLAASYYFHQQGRDAVNSIFSRAKKMTAQVPNLVPRFSLFGRKPEPDDLQEFLDRKKCTPLNHSPGSF